MREKALQIANQEEIEQNKLNYLREYLQQVILREMFEMDWLDELVFHGGTALRIIHDLNRFSEDLDFHLIKPDRAYSGRSKLNELQRRLKLNGYQIELTFPSGGNVRNAMVKFAGGLLYEAGISPHENQKLNIKLEIDTNPPFGFVTDTTLVNQYFPLALTHHDLKTFLAGKCHAILQREWTKGRDFYDLLFYLTRWRGLTPNLEYLNNALKQTGYKGSGIEENDWKELILERVEEIQWSSVEEDVEPFLLDRADLKAFKKKFLVEELTEY